MSREKAEVRDIQLDIIRDHEKKQTSHTYKKIKIDNSRTIVFARFSSPSFAEMQCGRKNGERELGDEDSIPGPT